MGRKLPVYEDNYFSIGAHREVKVFAPWLWWRRGAMRAAVRERRRCAAGPSPGGVGGAGGQLAAKTRPPGWVPGAAVQLLGARASAPVGNGGCPPPGADRRPGCARSAGENRKFPPRPVDNLWPYGIVASWHRLVSGGAAQAGMGVIGGGKVGHMGGHLCWPVSEDVFAGRQHPTGPISRRH